MASTQIIGKDQGSLRSIHVAWLDKVVLGQGETLSWVETFHVFDSSSWGFRDHIIRHGDAIARIHIRRAQECGHEVFVQVQGSPKNVSILAEEVVKMMGGKIVTFYPVRSWFSRVTSSIADAWREWQQEVRADMSVS